VFRRPKTPRESLHPLQSLVSAINDLTENGQEVNILKVRAHSGHPLNERADELAAQAAAHLVPPLYQSPTLHCWFRYRNGPPTQWNARLSALLVQEQAARTLVIPQPRALDDDTNDPDPSPGNCTQQWLTWEGTYRNVLGQVLRTTDYSLQLKRTMQAISHAYPTQAKLCQWGRPTTPNCPLGCGAECETLAHAQCECPCTKEARIAVHHDIWNAMLNALSKHLNGATTTLIREVTRESIRAACQNRLPATDVTQAWVEAALAFRPDGQLADASPPAHPLPHSDADSSPQPQGTRPAKRRLIAAAEPARQAGGPDTRPRDASVRRKRQGEGDPASAETLPPPRKRPTLETPGTVAMSDRRVALPSSSPTQRGTKRRTPSQVTSVEVRRTEDEATREPDPASQRPDGLLIDWATHNFYFLEFTRVNDDELDHLAQTSAKKKAKYQALKRHYLHHLPGWKGEVLPFTIGIRGTLVEAQWQQTLGRLGLPPASHEALAKTVVEATLQGLDTMFQARLAHLRLIPPPPRRTDRKRLLDGHAQWRASELGPCMRAY
jgi:hypothetical protein